MIESSDHSQKPTVVRYDNSISYPDTHWGIVTNTNLTSNPFYITTAEHFSPAHVVSSSAVAGKTTPVHISLNPTDCRGWRMLVTVTAHDVDGGVTSTFNRPPTCREALALSNVMSFLVQCVLFGKIGVFGQTFVAGNNSHRLDASTGDMVIGTEEEMSLIHGHVVARGPPGFTHQGVALLGPPVGAEFALKGPKVSWKAEELPVVVAFLRRAIDEEISDSENDVFGITHLR
jgi:hypothetical protein